MLTFIVIIAVLIILLYISIKICVTIEDETMLSIKYGVLKFKINLDKPDKPEKPMKEKKPKKEKVKKAKKTKTDAKKQTGKPPKKSSLEKLQELLVYVKPIFSELKPGLIKIVKCVSFTHIRIKMFVATDNAARTAIKYATTKIAVANVVSFLQLHSSAEFEQVEINADFISDKPAQSIYFEVKFRLLFILHNLLKMIFKIIIAVVKTNSNTKENDYVRKK